MAIEIGKGRDYLSDILNGKKHTLSSDVLTPLAVALQCDERYFTDEGFRSPGRSRRRLTEEEARRFDAAAERHNAYTWAWRIYRNLSLQEVAADSGLTAGTISDIEQGLLKPTTEQLGALAQALSTNVGLLKTNPFETNERVAQLITITEALDPTDLQTLVDMAETLERRKAG
ncbi:helix-turn-helix domain-containing protein [Brevundimonas naejangsanensis]|uniref:helix-turn-helix domain-containing protein n=1 Tax=Brevundimonas naejangsanensis TaxID=588932 RepID=UPI0026ED4DB6|nr:helix-turn-helix transcriptional regulator [Brevundimonas naejangsanensis]